MGAISSNLCHPSPRSAGHPCEASARAQEASREREGTFPGCHSDGAARAVVDLGAKAVATG